MRARAEKLTGLASNGYGSMITEPAPLGRSRQLYGFVGVVGHPDGRDGIFLELTVASVAVAAKIER